MLSVAGFSGEADAAILGGASNILASSVVEIIGGAGASRIARNVKTFNSAFRRAKTAERILNAQPPKASDPRLQAVFGQLFRQQDVRPGGTAAELLREIASQDFVKRNGVFEPRHLQKAANEAKNLGRILANRDIPISKIDRQVAERVRQDLLFATRQFK